MKLPQFSLRELFWLVLVVSLAVGWWIDRQQYLPKFNDQYHELAKEYLRVNFRYEYLYAHADRTEVDPAYNDHPERPLLSTYLQENRSGKRTSLSNFASAGIALTAWTIGILILGLLWRSKSKSTPLAG